MKHQTQNHSIRLLRICLLTAILLLSVACNSNVPDELPTTAPQATISSDSPTTSPPTATTPAVIENATEAAEPATAVPAPTIAATPTELPPNLRGVEYQQITFQYDITLAQVVTPTTRTGVPPQPAGPGGDASAANVHFDFGGYTVPAEANFGRLPQINVYDAADFANISPGPNGAAQEISNLQSLLTDRPADPELIPFLPQANAVQVFRSQVKYLDFINGAGVSFLTYYAQDVYPITNQNIFYTFQGLTDDGRYYISATFPVQAPILPASYETSPAAADYEAFANDYENYLATTIEQLNNLPPTDFLPNLTLLDNLFQTLFVPESLPLTETAVPTLEPCVTVPNRSIVTYNAFPNAVSFFDATGETRCDVQLQDINSGSVGTVQGVAGNLYYTFSNWNSQESAVWRLRADGSQEPLAFTTIQDENFFSFDFVVSPDGGRIAWSHTIPDPAGTSSQLYLWVANSDGSNQITLLDGLVTPDVRFIEPVRFAADTGNLLYAIQPNGLGGIWISFNGRYDNLYTVPADGSSQPQLLFDCVAHNLFLCIGDVLPEAQLIAYTDTTAGLIQLIGFDGTTIASLTPPATDYLGFPTFSLDGKLAFTSAVLTEGDANQFPTAQPGHVSLITPPYSGEATTLVTADGVTQVPHWFDNDNLIYLTLAADGSPNLIVIDTNGSTHATIGPPYYFATVMR